MACAAEELISPDKAGGGGKTKGFEALLTCSFSSHVGVVRVRLSFTEEHVVKAGAKIRGFSSGTHWFSFRAEPGNILNSPLCLRSGLRKHDQGREVIAFDCLDRGSVRGSATKRSM